MAIKIACTIKELTMVYNNIHYYTKIHIQKIGLVVSELVHSKFTHSKFKIESNIHLNNFNAKK